MHCWRCILIGYCLCFKIYMITWITSSFHQIENYLYRNHETRKYLQEQAYRLQQGIVTTTTQQVCSQTCHYLILSHTFPHYCNKLCCFLSCRWSTGFVWRCRTTWILWRTLRWKPSWRTSGQPRTWSKMPGTQKQWGLHMSTLVLPAIPASKQLSPL